MGTEALDETQTNPLKKKVLFLTDENPYSQAGNFKIRESHIIDVLKTKMEVELLCFSSENPASNLKKVPPDVRVSTIRHEKEPLWKWLIHPIRPRGIPEYSKSMAEAIHARSDSCHLIWISQFAMAQYVPLARELGYKIILDEHSVESSLLFGKALSSLKNLPDFFLAAQYSFYEGRFCVQSDAIVASSDIDASRLLKIVPGASVHVIPLSVDSLRFKKSRKVEGETLFFHGELNDALTLEGLHWFVEGVLPRLKSSMGARMPPVVVAGTDPSPQTEDWLQSAGIQLYRDPKSILPLLSEAAVFFVPLRSGGSARIKILEAMAAGKAVVSTGKGVEGLVLSPCYDIWIANEMDSFASTVSRLFEDANLREETGIHAVQTIERHYDHQQIRLRIERLIDTLWVSE